MKDSGSRSRLRCEEALEQIHRILDGESLDARMRALFSSHLAGCAECREAETQLGAVHTILQGLPQPPLPDDALAELLARTSRSGGELARKRRWGAVWMAAAAAAVIAVVAWGLWPRGPSEEELNLAATQARFVLRLTADALNKTERAVADKVLASEVSPVLRRVPIDWPGSTGESGGNRRNEAKSKT